MWAWVAFWGFCSVAAICSCIYKIVHVRTLRQPPDVELPRWEWEIQTGPGVARGREGQGGRTED